MKVGIGWAAGVLTGALAVGGITAAAIQVNSSEDCTSAALGCVASADKAASNVANKTSAAALAAAQTKLATATQTLGGTSGDATAALATATSVLGSGSGLAGGAVGTAQKTLESTLTKQLNIITGALNSASKTVADYKSGKISATDLAKVYNTVNGQLKTAKKEIDLVFATADSVMKTAEKSGLAALPLGAEYRGLLKSVKGQVDKLYKTASTEFKGAFSTVSDTLRITNGVPGLNTVPGVDGVLKDLPVGDPLKTVTETTKGLGLPVGDVTKLVDGLTKSLPLDVLGGATGGVTGGVTDTGNLPVVGPLLGGLLG